MAPPVSRSGPVPAGVDPDAYDRLRRRVLWSLPTGLYLLGTVAGSRRNLMTCNWVTQLATAPKLVGVSVENGVHTYELLREGRCFTLCLLGRDDRAVVRKFVKPARDDREARTLSGVPYRDAPVTGAPVVDSALAVLDCTLAHEVALGSHTLFVGEVVDVTAPEGDGELAVLRMEDTRMSYGG
ncbi:MAG: flavin reductase family protein [Actinomycetota bacterium]|nr:flavin reductase family protein [Actinomycetota bacterium]